MLVDSFAAKALAALCPPDHEYKLALYTKPLGAKTKYYTTDAEWKGAGYESGGRKIPGYEIKGAALKFGDVEWLNSDISARCGLIYDATTGEAVKIMDFGRTIGVMGGVFTVKMPKKGVVVLEHETVQGEEE